MIRHLINWVFALGRGPKRAVQILFDIVAISACFWLAMALRLDGISTIITPKMWSVLLGVFPTTIISFSVLGLYRAVVRYIAEHAVRAIVGGVLISAVTMFALSQMLTLGIPRSVPGIYLALLLIAIGGSRFSMRLIYLLATSDQREPVVIYGAGQRGVELLQAMAQSKNFRVALFVDDNSNMHGSVIKGVKVAHPNRLQEQCASLNIRTALVALDDDSVELRRSVALSLANLGLEVRSVPNVSDIVSGRVKVSELRRVTVEELLGREAVPPIPELLSDTILGKTVVVTGAGGSIGSELCRQILGQGPKSLILFDVSEFALYSIHSELHELQSKGTLDVDLLPILGTVVNEDHLLQLLQDHQVDTFFHAAAYKHVPMVEANVLEGIRNNIFGTHAAIQAAGKAGVKNFTLISTDKAVRPTNVMGATKRAAELVMQEGSKKYRKTKFCAVRFGNVLGSSGSVIPRFQKQLDAGGPITLTHTEITRYFMTIPEAAQLVIQASAMAELGEVYLLDMGDPIRILDLAKTMARLQGRQTFLEGKESPIEGAIAIAETGLRPGEKLYEELLIDGDKMPTLHPRIMCEPCDQDGSNVSTDFLTDLQTAIAENNATTATSVLKTAGLGFAPSKSE